MTTAGGGGGGNAVSAGTAATFPPSSRPLKRHAAAVTPGDVDAHRTPTAALARSAGGTHSAYDHSTEFFTPEVTVRRSLSTSDSGVVPSHAAAAVSGAPRAISKPPVSSISDMIRHSADELRAANSACGPEFPATPVASLLTISKLTVP